MTGPGAARSGNKTLAERNAASLAFRWAHVRRRFYGLAQTGPAPIASEALWRIADPVASRLISVAVPPRSAGTHGSKGGNRSSMPSSRGYGKSSP